MSVVLLDPMNGAEKEYSFHGRHPSHLLWRRSGDPPSANEWTEYGSRLYIDAGYHPEHATAETTDPWEVAIRIFRGDNLLFSRLCQVHTSDPTRDREFLVASNLGYEKLKIEEGMIVGPNVSWASHDNHLLPLPEGGGEATIAKLAFRLAAFQVSLSIITGNGCFMPSGPRYRFLISERSSLVRSISGRYSTGTKQLFLLRNEPLIEPKSGWYRIQVVANDSNLHHIPAWLRFAITKLVMLADLNNALNVPQFESKDDAMQALAVINADLSFKNQVSVVLRGQRRKLTALQIQWEHHEQASAFAKEHDLVQYQPALEAWAAILTAIEGGDLVALSKQLGWAARRLMAYEREDDLAREMTGIEAWAFSVKTMTLFDSKYRQPTGEFMSPLQAARRRFVDPDVLAEAALNPTPTEGRAALRAKFVQRARQRNFSHGVENGWCEHLVTDSDGDHVFNLDDPYSNKNVELEAWLAKTV